MKEIATLVARSHRVVVFTGAGISTESGIPDFRSPGGVWATNKPVMFDDFVADPAARYEYWRQKAITHHQFVASEPNAGHRVLARWEKASLVRGIITQNIDGLHQIAGSESVVELHGTARKIGCLQCGERFPADRWVQYFEDHDAVPDCPVCGGLLKHATISFGQSLDQQVLDTAVSWCRDADLVIALGSSLVVEPAASLPRIAQELGAALIIVNRDETPLDRIAAVRVYESIGDVLTSVDQLLR